MISKSVCDFIFVLTVLVSGLVGYRRGLLHLTGKALMRIGALVFTLLFLETVSSGFVEPLINDIIENKVFEYLTTHTEAIQNLQNTDNFPAILRIVFSAFDIKLDTIANEGDVTLAISRAISDPIATAVSYILTFVILYFAFKLAIKFSLKIAEKLLRRSLFAVPNKLAGLILGLLIGICICRFFAFSFSCFENSALLISYNGR